MLMVVWSDSSGWITSLSTQTYIRSPPVLNRTPKVGQVISGSQGAGTHPQFCCTAISALRGFLSTLNPQSATSAL